jgi:hypothetical protein
MIKHITLATLFITISTVLPAQVKYLKDVAQTQELSKRVAGLLSDNKVTEAFTEMTGYWPLPQSQIEELEAKTVEQLNSIYENYGKPIGTIKLKTENIAEVALRETYLVRLEYFAIRLIFTYYKNNQGWIVNGFKWDDSFKEEFK